MGGGNGQKAKMARDRNLEKMKAQKRSQLEKNKQAMNIQCKVCMQTFMCTTSEVKCKELPRPNIQNLTPIPVSLISKNNLRRQTFLQKM